MSSTKKEKVEIDQEAQRYNGNIEKAMAIQAEQFEIDRLEEGRILHKKYRYVPLTPGNIQLNALVVSRSVYDSVGPQSCKTGRIVGLDTYTKYALVRFHDLAFNYEYDDLLLLLPKSGKKLFRGDNPNLSFIREKSYE